MEETQKRVSGGRSENRRSNTNRRPRREQTSGSANRNAGAQTHFDPHFVSAPENPPLRKKAPAAQTTNSVPAEKAAASGRRTDTRRDSAASRSERTGRGSSRAQQTGAPNSTGDRSPRGGRTDTRSRGRTPAARNDDPGLELISRRPPQQKFSNFEEDMAAHGGATAPIEDRSETI